MKLTSFALASMVLLPAGVATAQSVSFEFIPFSSGANDMSPDGRWIVGSSSFGPYRYDTVLGERLQLPGVGRDAVAVSDDGQVILGTVPDPDDFSRNLAGIWRASTNTWEDIGFLPGALFCPNRSTGYELSADGTVATGLSWDGCNGFGFRWTEEDGMEPLENLANGTNRASVMSADGSIIGGFAQGSFSRTPALWNADGTGILLDPPDGDVLGEVHGISDDGSVILVEWDGAASTWSPGTGATPIGQGSIIASWIGIPTDIADDGRIVGFDYLPGGAPLRRAWVTDLESGQLITLLSLIMDGGGTVPPTASLEVCQAISADGTLICGHGISGDAWIVRIDDGSTCDGDIDEDGEVGFQDLVAMLASWGPCAGCAADINGDGEVTFQDLVGLLAAWGPCPEMIGEATMKSHTILSCALALTPVAIASAQSVTFEFIPFSSSANDMSPDGRWIVGNSGFGPYRYDTVSGDRLSLPSPGLTAGRGVG